MFQYKKELEKFRRNDEKQKDLIHKQSVLLKDYQILLKNIDRIQQEGDPRLYIQGGHLHYIRVEPEKPDLVYKVTFYVYRLSQHYYEQEAWISKAMGDMMTNVDIEFPYKTNTTFDLTNLDTAPEFQRQGHASHLMSAIVSFAHEHRIHSLFGRLDMQTPIGIDNLIHFYEKNGFKVGKSSFSMAIK